MSAYKNYVQDFPSRCRDILKMATKQVHVKQREVTLTLMVASAALVVPYERLNNHAFIRDNKEFPDAAKKLESLLKKPFLEFIKLPIEDESSNSSWSYGNLPDLNGGPDTWGHKCEKCPIEQTEQTKTIIKVIRNALAHGNIYTTGDPIKSIIFIQRNFEKDNFYRTIDYSFVLVTPDSFLKFLECWFDFIDGLPIDRNEIFEILKDAA